MAWYMFLTKILDVYWPLRNQPGHWEDFDNALNFFIMTMTVIPATVFTVFVTGNVNKITMALTTVFASMWVSDASEWVYKSLIDSKYDLYGPGFNDVFWFVFFSIIAIYQYKKNVPAVR